MIIVIAVSLFLGLVWLCVLDAQEMERQHCKQDGQSRETMVMQYIYDSKGNIQSMYPIWITEYHYTCDDYPRWR